MTTTASSSIEIETEKMDQTTTHSFDADISSVMNMIIHSFYSNKDIFLRELISNASDACDKACLQSLQNGGGTTLDPLGIEIVANRADGTLMLSDNGIGMSREELIGNLGTIAKSGTKAFLQELTTTKPTEGDTPSKLIGQFGVGFYSAYLVADQVTVISKRQECTSPYVWQSDSQGTFTVKRILLPKAQGVSCNQEPVAGFTRGTKIVLQLKKDQLQYLDEAKLKELVKRHSAFLSYPIKLWVEKKEKTTSHPEKEDEKEEDDAEDEDEKIDEPTITTVSDSEKDDKIKADWEVLNEIKPIWARKANEVTAEEHAQFYKTITGDWDKPLATTHFSAEGDLEFNCVLYVPSKAPYDLFDTNRKPNNIKLFVRKVFVTENCDALMPEWLRFVKGCVNAQDLPLNASRELLQQDSSFKLMRKHITKKCLEMFQELATEKPAEFKTFYEQFSKQLKLGIHEDSANRDKLATLLRFATSTHPEDASSSLADYAARMKPEQKEIYYI